MVWLQEICFSDVMSAGEWLWLLSFFPHLSCVAPAWIFLVSLFHMVLCFLAFYRTFVPHLCFFFPGFLCCCLLLHFGFALISFLSWYRQLHTEGAGWVGWSSAERATILLGASHLPIQSTSSALPHLTPYTSRGSQGAHGAGFVAWVAPEAGFAAYAQLLALVWAVPKLSLPRTK